VLKLLGAEQAGTAEKLSEASKGTATIWISEAASTRPVRVRTGVSDATSVEILEGAILEGALVVTRVARALPRNRRPARRHREAR